MARGESKRSNARGVAKLDLGEREIGLKLTLAAWDEIETTFDLENLSELETKLAKMSAKQMAQLIAILGRAAGEEIDTHEVLKSSCHIGDLIAGIGAALSPNRDPGAETNEKNGAAPSP